MTEHSHRWRKGSVFGCAFRTLDRNDLAKILYLAEAIDRRTHQPGRHGGIIGRTGLAVLRALITRFFNKKTGQLDPSLAAIARAANLARSTVQEAIKRLEAAGILEVTRRIVRVPVQLVSPVTGRPYVAQRVLQTSNGYCLNVPVPDRAEYGSFAHRARKRAIPSDTASRSGTTNNFIKSLPSLDEIPSEALRNALQRLQKAMTLQEATA